EHLKERTRPAVSQYDGQRCGPAPSRINEVNLDRVGREALRGKTLWDEAKVRQAVPLRLVGAPVEAVHPVVTDLPHVIEVQTVRPAGAGNGVGPASLCEAPFEVTEGSVGNADCKRMDCHFSFSLLVRHLHTYALTVTLATQNATRCVTCQCGVYWLHYESHEKV